MSILNFRTAFFAIIAISTIALSSCEEKYEGPTFTIKGAISNADGKVIKISNIGVDGVTLLDSATLDSEGSYEFTFPQPECYDFYRLELDDKSVIVSIDSTETVIANSDAEAFDSLYTIEGSPESAAIKEMEELQRALAAQVNAMLKNPSPAIIKTRNEIYELIGEFKNNIITQYIAVAPNKASAYYALSLSLNGEPIFSPMTNRTDSKCFAAVATNLQHRFPNAKRTQHITTIAENAMRATRPAGTSNIEIEETGITTTGLFDINLPSVNGDSIRLSSLAGKVVLLDFTVYEDPQISSRNIKLRELYNKYSELGFDIYQISYDTRENFWQMSASNLPWKCVRDGEGLGSSNTLLYNIQQIPTYYLINKENEIVLRDNQITDIESEIEKLLAE